MKNTASFLTLILLPFLLTACGTFEVSVLPTPTFTPPAMPVPDWLTPPPVSSVQCPPFINETVLPDKPDDAQSYIGHHYDELNMPEGLIFNGAGMLADDYSWMWVSRPDFDMEWIEQITCRDVNGTPYSTVVDSVKIPKLQEGYKRADVCSPVSGIGPVIVFGEYDKTRPQTMSLNTQGWKMYNLDFGIQINLQTMRFQTLSLDGLECVRASGLGD